MNDLTRGERLQIMLTLEELEALDTWRFATRMPSRAAAIRELLKRGLAAEGFTKADTTMKSRDFGVSETTEIATESDVSGKSNGAGKPDGAGKDGGATRR